MPVPEDDLRPCTLGKLAPLAETITLVEYDPRWPERFRHEAERVSMALGDRALRVEHVGSTAVPGLVAKPVIDIVLLVAHSALEAVYASALEASGYLLRVREPAWYEHRMFTGGQNDVNLHVFSASCSEVDRMPAFRDWLRTNEGDRELYARTKRSLAQQHWTSVQNYADAKTAVIDQILSRARASAVTGPRASGDAPGNVRLAP